LEGSAYRRLLYLRGRGRTLQTYPGSPRIAMELLGDAAEFVFCDLDGQSLATIAQDARALGVPAGCVRLLHGDGVSALVDELVALTEEEGSGTFLHVDPYRPLESGRGGESSLGLFVGAAQRGVGSMLWYGFDARDERALVSVVRIHFIHGDIELWNEQGEAFRQWVLSNAGYCEGSGEGW
jgi:hypothetical protein